MEVFFDGFTQSFAQVFTQDRRCFGNKKYASWRLKTWWRGLDLNQRPSGYGPDELPGCSTPRR